MTLRYGISLTSPSQILGFKIAFKIVKIQQGNDTDDCFIPINVTFTRTGLPIAAIVNENVKCKDNSSLLNDPTKIDNLNYGIFVFAADYSRKLSMIQVTSNTPVIW